MTAAGSSASSTTAEVLEPQHGIDIEAQARPHRSSAASISRSESGVTLPQNTKHQSKTSSTPSPTSTQAARLEKEHVAGTDTNLVEWPPGDSEHPQNWSSAKKWLVIVCVSSCSFCVTCNSSIVVSRSETLAFQSALRCVAKKKTLWTLPCTRWFLFQASTFDATASEFSISREVSLLGLSLFVLGLGTAPLLLGPVSELTGRRPVYLASLVGFLLLQFPVAFANNAPVYFIFRFLVGLAGSAFLSVAGGTISDLFKPNDLFTPMGFYTASPFLGPTGKSAVTRGYRKCSRSSDFRPLVYETSCGWQRDLSSDPSLCITRRGGGSGTQRSFGRLSNYFWLSC